MQTVDLIEGTVCVILYNTHLEKTYFSLSCISDCFESQTQ
jgi:hypothetical protein